MKLDKHTHRQLQFQNILFYLLLAIAVFLLSRVAIQTDQYADWTANQRLSLSAASQSLLAQIKDDITIDVFVSPDSEYLPIIKQILGHYQHASPYIKVTYIDPATAPDKVRQWHITRQGELLVSHGSQRTHVMDFSEQSITNALSRVLQTNPDWIIFLTGHGERTPFKSYNFHFSRWGEQLTQKGFKFRALNLIDDKQIPVNTGLLVIASPKQDLLPGEISIINTYIEHGGQVLLMTDPDTGQHLSPITDPLQITLQPGTVIDPNTQLLGINDPTFVLVNNYANHPVSKAIPSVTVFPGTVALQSNDKQASSWTITDLLKTQKDTWIDTDTVHQSPSTHPEHTLSGPFTIGYLLEREYDGHSQRIAIIGDSDFVTNRYLGNAGNLDLAMSLINWLMNQDTMITVPAKTTIDQQLTLSKIQSLLIGIGFLFVIPLLLLMIGLIIWNRRRRR